MLDVRGLSAAYGQHPALNEVSLSVGPGEIVVILGANGAGKSTLLRAIAGICEGRVSGQVMLNGASLTALNSDQIVEQGVALVPEGRAACTPGYSSECPRCTDDGGSLPDIVTLQRALHSYQLAGAEMAEGKTTPLRTQFTAWGTDVDGMRGVVGVGADKRRQTFRLCVDVVFSGRVTKAALQSLCGTLVYLVQ